MSAVQQGRIHVAATVNRILYRRVQGGDRQRAAGLAGRRAVADLAPGHGVNIAAAQGVQQFLLAGTIAQVDYLRQIL